MGLDARVPVREGESEAASGSPGTLRCSVRRQFGKANCMLENQE